MYVFFNLIKILAGIMFVCDKERVNPTTQWLDSLVAKAGGNMRRAICMLEAGVSQQ
jgi:DNA polymerase III delta prime subunit